MQFLIATLTNILYDNSQKKLLKNIKRDLHQQNPNFSILLWDRKEMTLGRGRHLPVEQLGTCNSHRRFFVQCKLILLKSVTVYKQFPLIFSTLGLLLECILPFSFIQKETSPPLLPRPCHTVDHVEYVGTPRRCAPEDHSNAK